MVLLEEGEEMGEEEKKKKRIREMTRGREEGREW